MTIRKKIWIGLLLSLCCIQIDAARILAIFPTPSISHQFVFRPLIQELVKRGHEVIVLTPDPMFPKGGAPANLTEIDVHDISYANWQDLLRNHNGRKSDVLLQIQLLLRRNGKLLDLQLQTVEGRELLKKPKNYFDVLILEACNRVALGIHHIFDAPIIQMSSYGTIPAHYGYLGAPTHPFLYPTPDRQRLYNLSMWEKILELLKFGIVDRLLLSLRDHDYSLMRKIFGDVPPYEQVGKNIKLLFINEHPIWADNRPVAPNIQYIGGIHQRPEQELPKDLKSYLDSSENCVIYMSFGTNVMTSSLKAETIQIIMKVFSELPYDVLMKWDEDELPGLPPNVKIQKWFPQSDLLKHPKIKLFITQGGLQSTDEAIDAAVPVLGIPMLGDQWYNTEKYVRHKIGLQLNMITLNEHDFKNAIQTIITDKSYKQNMLRLRTLMRDYPIKPVDLAVWWTEHIIKYGGDHLIPPAAYLHWAEYYEVKLILVVLIVFTGIACLLVYTIKVSITYINKLLKRAFKKIFMDDIKMKRS